MGTVDTVSNLPTTGQKNGDVYNVKSENKDYAWNDSAQQWVELGSATNLDNVAMKNEIKIKRALVTLETIINANTNYSTVYPYEVGNDSLEVYYCSTKLQKRTRLQRNRQRRRSLKRNTVFRQHRRLGYV